MEPLLAAPVIAHRDDEPHDGEEAWVVVEGELMVRVGDRELVLAAGEALHVPAGVPRTIRAADGARYVRARSAWPSRPLCDSSA
jgi:ethanolamine utilization protein EutQ (cupin superfamily)